MSSLYVVEQGASISVGGGKFIVDCGNNIRREIPEETLDSIVVFGNVQVSFGAQKKILEKGISMSFLSTRGRYFGRLHSTSHPNAERIKKQVYMSDNEEQRVLFARMTLRAKIHNQIVLLRRDVRNSEGIRLDDELLHITTCEKKIEAANTIEEIMGHEGIAARYYFRGLSQLVNEDFHFSGRSKRPPKDPFNAMLSLGYTIVFYEIYAELENQNIHPYISFVHSLKEHHPAMVSDLLEEWRAVIVDSTVMSLVQGREIMADMFSADEETGAVIISKEGVRILVRKLEQKMGSYMNYLDYLDNPTSFRKAIWWQVKMLAQGIDNGNLSVYRPLRIR